MADKSFGEKVQDFGETVKKTILGEEMSADMKARCAIEKAELAKAEARAKINEAGFEAKQKINEESCIAKAKVDEHNVQLKNNLESR